MKRRIRCDGCHKIYVLEKEDIKKELVDKRRWITRTYFACPQCGIERTILYITPATYKLIKRRTQIRNTIRDKAVPLEMLSALLLEDEDLKDEIRTASNMLKGELEQ